MSALTPDETVLGLLAVQARHGYELLECFRSTHALGRVWNLSTSQIYAVLKRLERAGQITGREVTAGNAPPRVEYSLTPAGQKRLDAWLREPQPSASIRRIRVEFLSRLYLARQLNLPAAWIIQRQRAACERQLADMQAERRRAAPGIDLMALELHISQIEAVLRWINCCESTSTNRTDH